MNTIVSTINLLSEKVGKAASWISTALVILIVIDVIFRYIFKDTSAWIIELEWHFFAILFLLGGAYAFEEDKHVRVDLFYSNFSERDKAWVNLLGTVLLLIPWCVAIVWFAGKYALLSFQVREGSPDPGGLPARYFIKSVIVLGFLLLTLQAISVVLQSILTLRHTQED
ncbi:MAG: TRAP transporter small permease subunit [Bacteroidota bacterium]